MNREYEVAVYYFPNYHQDERNKKRHGVNWMEWELVKRAEPRFDGHMQPKVPLWGYEDESDPEAMAKKYMQLQIMGYQLSFLIGTGMKMDHFFSDALKKAF